MMHVVGYYKILKYETHIIIHNTMQSYIYVPMSIITINDNFCLSTGDMAN